MATQHCHGIWFRLLSRELLTWRSIQGSCSFLSQMWPQEHLSTVSSSGSFAVRRVSLPKADPHRRGKTQDQWSERSGTPRQHPRRGLGENGSWEQVWTFWESDLRNQSAIWWNEWIVSCTTRDFVRGCAESRGYVADMRSYILLRNSGLSAEDKRRWSWTVGARWITRR